MTQYIARVRDATMQKRLALMCAGLSEALKEAGGREDLGRETENLLETLARNGIHAKFTVITGPYTQKLFPNGMKDYS